MRYSLFSLVLGTLLLVSFTACAQRKATPPIAPGLVAEAKPIPKPRPLAKVDTLFRIEGLPNRDIAHESYLRGLSLREGPHKDVATVFYKRALAHEPGNRFLAFELVELLVEQSLGAEAFPLALAAKDYAGSPTGQQYYLLARLFREHGHIDSSKVYYEKVVDLAPGHFRALYEYSVVLEITQDYQELSRIYSLLLPQLNYPKPMVEKQLILLKLKGTDSSLVEFLEGAVQARPDFDLAKYLLEAYVQSNRFAEAYALGLRLDAAGMVDPKSLQWTMRAAAKLHGLDSALHFQRRLVRMDSTNHEEHLRLAMLEYEVGALDSSLSRFRSLLAARPDDHLAWFYLSVLEQQRQKNDQAFVAIERAIALKPDALAYRNQLATLHTQLGEYSKAHAVLDQALQQHKTHPLAMQFKGSVFVHQAMRMESTRPKPPEAAKQARNLRLQAIAWFRKASAMDSVATDLLFDLAANLERVDSVDASRRVFEKLLRLEPRNHSALNYLGYTLVERNVEVDVGGRLIDSALALDPGNIAYLDSRAWYFYRKKEFAKARHVLDPIMTSHVDVDATIWEHYALICEALQDLSSARQAWEKVLQLDAEHAMAKERLRREGQP